MQVFVSGKMRVGLAENGARATGMNSWPGWLKCVKNLALVVEAGDNAKPLLSC